MLLPTGRRGRPRFDINPEQLEYLLENGFTGPDIARMMCVSLRTIRRRITEYDLHKEILYSDTADEELD